MKILITGAQGLVGYKLMQILHHQPGISALGTIRRSSDIPSKNYFLLDITSRDQINQVLSVQKPDTVIHTVAMTNVDECEQKPDECHLINVTAVEHIIAKCESIKANLIFLSTDFIFDGSTGPLDEKQKPDPVNVYGKSKAHAETLIQQSNLQWTIIRTALIYGNTPILKRSNIVLWVIKSLKEGKPIKVVDDQWRTPTLAEDLAMGCWLASQHHSSKTIYHISGQEMMTPYEIALRTASFYGLDKSLITRIRSDELKQVAPRPRKTGFIIDKAKQKLNYRPHTFEEGLKKMQPDLPGYNEI